MYGDVDFGTWHSLNHDVVPCKAHHRTGQIVVGIGDFIHREDKRAFREER